MPSLKGKRCLLTGVCGFIGSHIAEALLNEGAEVIGIDCLLRDNLRNIDHLRKMDNGFHFYQKDIRNAEEMKRLCKDVDMICHQAAVCIRWCQANPQSAIDINVGGTINMLEAAVANGVPKFVAASSASVYGDPITLPITESQPLLAKNLYGVTKICNEESYKYYAREKGLDFVAFRYMNVYGTRSNPDAYYTNVIPTWIKLIREGKRPVIFGDGSQTMDFVNVDDVVQANMLALKSKDKLNSFYNVGTGTETSLKQLCEMILKLMDSDLKPDFQPAKVVDVTRRCADLTAIKRALGFEAKVRLEDGLREIIKEH